jgi:peptidyl-prolyl cis-trans isomerase SurA
MIERFELYMFVRMTGFLPPGAANEFRSWTRASPRPQRQHDGRTIVDRNNRPGQCISHLNRGVLHHPDAERPFSRLAQNLSEDPGTASSGGDLGWFKRGSLDSLFEEAAFKLPVGVVSGIVQTPFGYHLIKVEESDKAKGEIHARHILFRVTPTQADADRVHKRILDIRTQAAKGVDFGTLAHRYSKYQGPATAEGDLGELPLNVFSPDFKAALDTLEIGELSAPLLNAQGYNLFKVVDRSAERPYQLAEVKDDLPDMVRQAKLKEQYDAYVADLRKKAHIEYR